jgi:hypothetical protein
VFLLRMLREIRRFPHGHVQRLRSKGHRTVSYSTHTCHAHGCTLAVPPARFMCRTHWFTLPIELRDAVWREYRPGQEHDKRPSVRYMAVQKLSVACVVYRYPNQAAQLNNQAARTAAPYLFDALVWRHAAITAGQGDPLAGHDTLIKEMETAIEHAGPVL